MTEKYQNGYTLVEGMICLCIVSLLLGLAVPGYQSFLQTHCKTVLHNQFVSDLNYAREQAVHRNETVSVSARKPSDGQNEWGKGWRVYLDRGGDAGYDAEFDEILVLREEPACSITLDSTRRIRRFVFNGEGWPSTWDVLNLCPLGGDTTAGRRITVHASGSIQSELTGAGGACS